MLRNVVASNCSFSFWVKYDFAAKISRLIFLWFCVDIFTKSRLNVNVFAAIFGDEFHDLASNLCTISRLMLPFSRLMMTNWKVHKFAANVNEFAANILFYPYSTMRISNDDLQIIIRGKGPSGADENFILISQSYTFRRGVRTTKEIHTSYSYLIMLIPASLSHSSQKKWFFFF